MPLLTYDEFIDRVSDGYSRSEPISGVQVANSVVMGSSSTWSMHGSVQTKTIPTLETGVDAYIPTAMAVMGSTAINTVVAARMTPLGSLDIATPTFTDGSAMPSRTVGGLSYDTAGVLLMEVTTALNATPGAFTVTYVDQDGNAAETTTSRNLGASAPVGSMGFVELNTGDYAVRDVTTATRTGGTTPTGVIQFWGVEPIACLDVLTAQTWVAKADLLNDGLNIVRLGGGEIVGFVMLGSVTAKRIIGDITYVGDTA